MDGGRDAGAGVSAEEFERERAERAAQMADELLAAVAGEADQDLDVALRRVAPDDAPAVLGAVLRRLAAITAADRLRDDDEGLSDDEAAPADEAPRSTLDDGEVADPWATGESVTDALELGRVVFDALAGQGSVSEWRRALLALSEDDLLALAAERSLVAMLERRLAQSD